MIRVVFLDIDNTLLSFNGYVREAMRDGFAEFGLRPYDESMHPAFERINNLLWGRIEQGTLTLPELEKVRWNMVFAELGIDFDGPVFEKYFREKLFTSAVEVPGASETLEYLSSKYMLCAASNGPCEQQLNRLRIAGMYDRFTHFFISEKIGAPKPGREFFDYCFAELRSTAFRELTADETMIIGDSMTADIGGGKEYGMQTCLYQPEPRPGQDISAADYVIRDLVEIKQIL